MVHSSNGIDWTSCSGKNPYKSEALIVIDTVTNLVELVRLKTKDSDHVMQKFVQFWFARYLWPQCCIHDPGGKFTAQFQTLL